METKTKTLLIELPTEKLKGPGEAKLTFSGVQVFKLRLDHNSTYIHFYDRLENELFSWEGPNQAVLSVVVVDDPNRARPHVTVNDAVGLSEVHSLISSKVNRYQVIFPANYNWIQVDNWAIPIP